MRQAVVTLAALAIGAFAIGMDTFVMIGVLSEVTRDLSISVSLAGQLVTIYALGYAIFAPVCGWFFGGWEKKRVILISMTLFAVGNGICALSDDYALIVAGRVASALGAASFTPVATALASSLVNSERRGMALAIVFGGMTVAQAAGIPIATFIGQTFGWRLSFWAVCALGAVTVVLLSVLLRPMLSDEEEEQGSRAAVLKNFRVQRVLCITFLVVLSEFVVYSYISPVIGGTTFQGTSILPAVLFAYGCGAVMGNVVTGFLTDRMGPKQVLLLSVTAQTALVAALIAFRAVPEATVLIGLVWGIASYMYLVPIQHELLSIEPKAGVLAISLNSSVIYLGISASGAVGGAILSVSSVEMLAGAAILAGSCAVLLTFVSFSHTARSPSTDVV